MNEIPLSKEILQTLAQQEVNQMDTSGMDEYELDSIPYPYYQKDLLEEIFKLMYKERKTKITRLCLREMNISDETVDVICELDWLKALYLPFNNLTNTSVERIASKLPDLEELNLAWNDKIDDVRSCREKMRKLKILWINGTQVCLTEDDITNWIAESKLEDVDFKDSLTPVQQFRALRKLWKQESQGLEVNKEAIQDVEESLPTFQTQDMNVDPNQILSEKIVSRGQSPRNEQLISSRNLSDQVSSVPKTHHDDEDSVIQDKNIDLIELSSEKIRQRDQDSKDEKLVSSRGLSDEGFSISNPISHNEDRDSVVHNKSTNPTELSPEWIGPRDCDLQDEEQNNLRNQEKQGAFVDPNRNDDEQRESNYQDEEQNNPRNQEEQVAFMDPNRNGDELGESNYQDDEQNNSKNQEGQGAFVDSDPSQKNDYSKKFNSTLAVRNPQKNTQNATQSRCMNCLNFCNPF